MMKLRAIEKFLFKEDILRADFKNLQEGIKEDVNQRMQWRKGIMIHNNRAFWRKFFRKTKKPAELKVKEL